MTGWRRLAFGSVIEKVVRTANCPLLVLRAKSAAQSQTPRPNPPPQPHLGAQSRTRTWAVRLRGKFRLYLYQAEELTRVVGEARKDGAQIGIAQVLRDNLA